MVTVARSTSCVREGASRLRIAARVLFALTLFSPCLARAQQDALIAKEKEAWETFKTKKTEAFLALAADEFRSIDQYGSINKAGQAKAVSETKLKGYTLSDIRVAMVNDDTAILTYDVKLQGTYKGHALPVNNHATSVWVKRGGQWVAVLHQETPAVQPPR